MDIDNAYAAYRKGSGAHKAFAFTPLGAYWWQTEAGTAAQARQVALRQCETVRDPAGGPCSIGDVDGRVVDRNFRRVLEGTLREPITVTVEQGGKTTTYSGTMTVQRHWSPARRISLSYDGGAATCTNGRAYLGLGIRFSIQCGEEKFSGRAKRLGKKTSGFYRGTELFETKVRSGGAVLTFTNAK